VNITIVLSAMPSASTFASNSPTTQSSSAIASANRPKPVLPFLGQMCEGVTSGEVFDVFLAQATGVEAPKAKDRRTQSTKLRDHLDQIEAGQVSNCAVCRCRRRVPVGCVGQAFRLAVAFRFGLWSADILGDCRNISSAWPRSSAPDIVAAAGILVFANSSHSHKIAPMFC
jgi:hypothetical protein